MRRMSADCSLPGLGLRERKKVRTRDAILHAAIELFERKGYEHTTVEEIAEAADVSPRTFFRYFDSKVEAVMTPKDDRSDFSSLIAARPPEEGPVEAMRQVVRSTLGALVVENPLMVRQMRIMMGTPSLNAVAREHFNEHSADMASEFAERLGVPADDLRPHVIAAAIGNCIWTVVNRWVAEEGSPERLLEMLDEGCHMLAAGLDRMPAPEPST